MKKLSMDVKANWLEALRSGKYEQAQRWLRTSDGFCCLGVLCDTQKMKWKYDKNFYTTPNGDSSVPGMADIDPEIYEVLYNHIPGAKMSVATHLANINDRGSSFAEIANWIEENR